MNISEAQFKQFAAQSLARFEAGLVAHVHENFPALADLATDDQLLRGIRQVVEKGQGFGIELQDDLRRFLELLLSHGMQVLSEARFAPIVELLRRTDLDGTQKMDGIDAIEPLLLDDIP